jgi:hypothetical protein
MTRAATAQRGSAPAQGEVCFVRPENEGKMNIVESWIRISTYNVPVIGGQKICVFVDPGLTDLTVTSAQPYGDPQSDDDSDACTSRTVKVNVRRERRRVFFIFPRIHDSTYVCGWTIE